jgi:hexosaminidase
MKKISLLVFACLFGSLSFAQQTSPDIAIIPEPVKITKHAGQFTLPKIVVVQASASPEINPILDLLKNKLSTAAGKTVAGWFVLWRTNIDAIATQAN